MRIATVIACRFAPGEVIAIFLWRCSANIAGSPLNTEAKVHIVVNERQPFREAQGLYSVCRYGNACITVDSADLALRVSDDEIFVCSGGKGDEEVLGCGTLYVNLHNKCTTNVLKGK